MILQHILFEKREPDHVDARRGIHTIFNADVGDFVAQQVKIADIYTGAVLGGHFHNYRELFYVWQGQATFTLCDPATKETREFVLDPQTRLLVPPGIAHKAVVTEGTLLLGATEEPYISAAENDIPYEF
ncbi:MAG: hypothetical protein H6502_03020 [Candidatus Woesearchaeota archaeon]|nr:MAG: hypothetical protein H6502_03020 [Candidatus Woesearchaeota archaeon]